jgi:hypothetical protein
MVTDEQVRLVRQKRMEGKTLETAAAAGGMCERTARDWQAGPLPSEVNQSRHWRTRVDPFEDVWTPEVEPLLREDKKGELQAKTIFNELVARHPGEFEVGQLRTLQRHVRDWRSLHGPEKEVYFPQQYSPGQMAAFDFTHATVLEVTINGQLLQHLLFVFKLCFSKWTWVQVAFGETFEALVSGLQGALWELGGAPTTGRSDNLSAATHELKKTGGRTLNKRFKDVLDHYGIRSSRIQPGEAHENGVAEKGNELVKNAINQELLLRGNRDFAGLADYEKFLRQAVDKTLNQGLGELLAEERRHLLTLPAMPVPEYTTHRPVVRSWSTIRVGNRTYSVPSRLIGQQVEVRQYPNVLEVRLHDHLVETLPRLRGEGAARIDYRHIIWSLVRKPGAFANYRFREELFPTLVFRRAYDVLCGMRGSRADVEYVRILHLAASTIEAQVERALEQLIERGTAFDYAAVKAIAKPEQTTVPDVKIPRPDLAVYDLLLGGAL